MFPVLLDVCCLSAAGPEDDSLAGVGEAALMAALRLRHEPQTD